MIHQILIRCSDILFAFVGIILFLPLFLIIALWIKLDSNGPVFFRQVRVGKNNRDFRLIKFRTMIVDADKKGLITIGTKDPRVTRAGSFLRRFKLDELPQLFNVLSGKMSLVGPRPEVRKYVDLYTPEQRMVLTVRPGITDFASIEFSDENELLNKSKDPDHYYIHELIPAKIRLNRIFIDNPSYFQYLRIIFLTLRKLIFRGS